MRKKVDLVACNMEQAEKIRLRDHIKQVIGMAGLGEVEALYKDDKTLADIAEHASEIDQVDRFAKRHARLFFASAVAFLAGMMLRSPAAGRDAARSLASFRSLLGEPVVASDGTNA